MYPLSISSVSHLRSLFDTRWPRIEKGSHFPPFVHVGPSTCRFDAMFATKACAMAMHVDRNVLQKDRKLPPASETIDWKKKLAKGAASLAVAGVLLATPWDADATVNLFKPDEVALYQEVCETNETRAKRRG